MNPLLKSIVNQGLMLDALGLIGLLLIALAAVKLARRHSSWGGNMMAIGAIALLIVRTYLITAPFWVTDNVLRAIGPIGISMMEGLPTLLLTFGLAGVVWGLWGHERWLNEESH